MSSHDDLMTSLAAVSVEIDRVLTERDAAVADYARVTTALNDSIAREADLLGRAERAEAVVERMRDRARRARDTGSAGRVYADVLDEALADAGDTQ